MRIAASRRAHWKQSRSRTEGVHESRVELSSGGWIDVAHIPNEWGGDPLLLVAGLSGGWRLLQPLARRLAQRHSVYIASLRGDGLDFPATTDAAKSVSDHAADLAELIDRLGLERPAIMGVSFGGAAALELAITRPQLPAALVLHGVEARFGQVLGARIARNVLERFALPKDSPFLNQFFHLLFGREPEPGPMLDFVVKQCWSTGQGELVRRFRALESFDVREHLWRVEAPTMVLAAAKDVIVPPARQKALADSIFGARFAIIPDCGHIGFLTHARDTARVARSLLGRVPA